MTLEEGERIRVGTTFEALRDAKRGYRVYPDVALGNARLLDNLLLMEQSGGKLIDVEGQLLIKRWAALGREVFKDSGSNLLAIDGHSPDQPIRQYDVDAIQQFYTVIARDRKDFHKERKENEKDFPVKSESELSVLELNFILEKIIRHVPMNHLISPWNDYGRVMQNVSFLRDSTHTACDFVAANLVDDFNFESKSERAKLLTRRQKQLKRLLGNGGNYQVEAAALLYNVGNLITDSPYTSEIYSQKILREIGIRPDILEAITGINVMWNVEPRHIHQLLEAFHPIMNLVRIASEFGTPYHRGQVYDTTRYVQEQTQFLPHLYLGSQNTGELSDAYMVRKLDTHLAMLPDYYAAMNKWVSTFTHTDLSELVTVMRGY